MSKCTHGKHDVCANCWDNLPSPSAPADDPAPIDDKKYRMLEEGEIVQEGDEVLHESQGWIPAKHGIGRKAPDPRYTSHSQYRRPAPDMDAEHLAEVEAYKQMRKDRKRCWDSRDTMAFSLSDEKSLISAKEGFYEGFNMGWQIGRRNRTGVK